MGLGDQQLLTKILDLLGVDEIADDTLTGLLALLGLNLADPFNLSNLLGDRPGVNIVIAGPEFAALKCSASTWDGCRRCRTRWPTR